MHRPAVRAARQLVVSSVAESLYYVRSRETPEPERALSEGDVLHRLPEVLRTT